MSDKQAVIEDSNTEATPSAADDNAQDDLDSLLNEFDQQAKPTETKRPEPQSESQPQLDQDTITLLKQDAEERRRERAQKETQQGISSALSVMKDNLDKSLPDSLVEGFLIREVENDPRALGLWQSRHTNADQWNRYVTGVAKKLNKEVADLPDKKLSDDRDVVTSAIHSASNHKPQETSVNWAGLDDRDFEAQKALLKASLRKK